MKVYDIALMLIRAVTAIAIIRELVSVAYYGVRLALLASSAAGGSGYLRVEETTLLLSPIVSLVTSLIILALAKPIARFAAKLAAPSDAAGEFR